MSTETVLCVATFTAKENLAAKLNTELSKLVEKTNQEPGCVSYDLYASTTDPRKFLMHEVYQDKAAYDLHANSEYLQAFLALAPDLTDAVEVKTL